MEGNSECNSESNSNDDNSNSIPIPPGLGQANSIPELDLEFATNSNSGAELTPALQYIEQPANIVYRAISQKMGHRHHFFIVTELLHVAYQKIATRK